MSRAPVSLPPPLRTAPRRVARRGYLTFEQFLALPSPERAEWVNGRVVEMPGVTSEHASITAFLLRLLGDFVEYHQLGLVLGDPFLVKLSSTGTSRAPDILFVRTEHLSRLQPTHLDGPCDMALEVISPGSRAIDRGEKFYEYEAAGIGEYWLVDPDRKVAEFYRLDNAGRYQLVPLADGVFYSDMLPGFWLRVAWLWDRPTLREARAALGIS